MVDIAKEVKRKKTILIFGISSFIGSNLAEFLKKDYRIVGTYNKNPVKIPGILTLSCDVLVKEEVQLALFSTKPDITIYAIGMSSIYDCAKSEELADALNSAGLFNVVEYCQRYKSQICYFSSNFVFSGEDKNYMEMDIPDANTVYGKTQAQAEFYIQKTSLNYLIFRTCRLYGRSYRPGFNNWFELMQKKLMDRESFVMDSFINHGFLDVYYLALIVRIAIEKQVKNRLFQVSTTDIMNYYDFSKLYCEIFGDSGQLINNGKWIFPIASKHAVARTGESLLYKMDISNIEGFLNIELPSVKDSLELTFKRLNGVKKTDRNSLSKDEGVTFI